MTGFTETDLEYGLDFNLTEEKQINLNAIKTPDNELRVKPFQRYRNRDQILDCAHEPEFSDDHHHKGFSRELDNTPVSSLGARNGNINKIEIRGDDSRQRTSLILSKSQEPNLLSKAGTKSKYPENRGNIDDRRRDAIDRMDRRATSFENTLNQRGLGIKKIESSNTTQAQQSLNLSLLKEPLRVKNSSPTKNLDLTDSQQQTSAKKPSKPTPFSKPLNSTINYKDIELLKDKKKITIIGEVSSPKDQRKQNCTFTPKSGTNRPIFQSPTASGLQSIVKETRSNNRTTQVVLGLGRRNI